jgi:hypothetical protein
MKPDMSAVRTTSRLAFAALGLALLSVVAAPAAGAQEDDPYGSTTTTAPTNGRGDILATCSLSVPEGRPGDTVTATVNGVFLGETVRIFFDDLQVGITKAPATVGGQLARTGSVTGQSAGGAVVFGGAAVPAQQQPTVSVQITFTVPPAAAGTHIVTAVGDTFTCFCNPDGAFRVLGAKAGKGAMPRTGIYVALLLAAALALLVVGRALVTASRRRRAAVPVAEDYVVAREDDEHLLTPRR